MDERINEIREQRVLLLLLFKACNAWLNGYDQHKRIQYCRDWEQEAYRLTAIAIKEAEESCTPARRES